ncbi:MAG TPA: hypothetical protein VF092_13130 [Longimicrobium sp.]
MTNVPGRPLPETRRLRFERAGPADEARLQAIYDARPCIQSILVRRLAEWTMDDLRQRAAAGDALAAANLRHFSRIDTAAHELAASAADANRVTAFAVLRETGADAGAFSWRWPCEVDGVAALGPIFFAPDPPNDLFHEALAALERTLAAGGAREIWVPMKCGFLPHHIMYVSGYRELRPEGVQLGLGYESWQKRLGDG